MQSIAKGKSGQKSHGKCEAYFTEHRDDFPMVESFVNVPQNVGNQEYSWRKEGPLLNIDDMFMDFTSSDIYGDQI